MVTLTQSNQLSQIPGSAGQQSVIQDQSPTAGEAVSGLVKSATAAYDVAGDIYAKNQSRTIVNEEIENVDKAIALAEQKKKDENFVEPDEMPVSDAEFTVIENAVRSGAMSREKARLLASSRLRTRISEQPFFAGKLRQAASEVVGFNIESEPARQYFAAFQTEAQLGQNSVNKYRQEKMQEAAARAPVLGVTVEEVYQDLILRDEIKERKEAALARKELGGMSDAQAFTELNQENSKVRFTNVLATFKEQFANTGSVDEAAAEIILTEAEAREQQELVETWTGDQSSTEFQRAMSTISAGYGQIRDYANAVGYDNLNKINLQRAKDARALLGDKLLGKQKFIAENLGQQTASLMFETLSQVTDPSRLEAMFKSNPTLGRAAAIIGNETAQKAFGEEIAKTFEDIANNREPEGGVSTDTGVDQGALLDSILSEMFNSGEEGEKNSINYLNETGKGTKALSLIATKAPGRANEDTKQFFKNVYKNDMPRSIDSLASTIIANPDLDWSIQDDGQISIVEPTPSTDVRGGRAMREDIRRVQRAQAGFDPAQRLAEQINLYNESINKGWGTVVDTSSQKHRRDIEVMLDSRVIQGLKAEFENLVLENNPDQSRRYFDKLKTLDPSFSEFEFDIYQETIRRRNNVGG